MDYVCFSRLRAGSVRGRRWFSVMLAGACIGGLGVLSSPASAAGPTIDLTCVIQSAVFSFSPPLDGGSTHSTVAVKLTGCRSPNGSHAYLRSATVPESSAIATGCPPLPMTIRGDAVLFWNDGSSSTLTFDISTIRPADRWA